MVEQTDTNVVGTAEPLFTKDTQHDVEPTVEEAAENPMSWKEWLADSLHELPPGSGGRSRSPGPHAR